MPADWSVIASSTLAGLSVVSSATVAIVTPRYAAKRAAELARENRVQERLADAYLDVLRIVEREGLWISAQTYNLWAASVEIEYDPIPRRRPQEPDLADQATVAALLAAFGSEAVRARYAEWRATVDKYTQAHGSVMWELTENHTPDEPPRPDELQDLNAAGDAEQAVRERLADAIAEELGHRGPQAGLRTQGRRAFGGSDA